jgi:WD40 repeat protein
VPGTPVPKITDFGLAKDRTAGRKLTASGVTMGTPCYMAPEQARGAAVGPAADVYALGSILYEMLAGRTPFEGDTAIETVTRLLDEEPLSPSRLRPALPRDLVVICLKCLEKAPNRRYTSAGELAEDLRRWQAGKPIGARAVGPLERAWRWCRRRPLVAALIALSALLALVLAATVAIYDTQLQDALARAEGRAEDERRQIVQLNVTLGHIALDHGDAFTAVLRYTEAFRLDGDSPENEAGHRKRIAAALRSCPGLLLLRVHEARVLCTSLGPEGGWMATIGPGNVLRVTDALTGRAAGPDLTPERVPFRGAVSPDGKWLATIGSDGTAQVWDLRAGTATELPGSGNPAVRQAAFHAGGVLFTRHADATVHLWDLTGGAAASPRPLFGGAFTHTVLSEDARWLFTLTGSHVGQEWDVATGKAVGSLVLPGHAVSPAAVSPTGRQVALIEPDRSLRVWDVTAGAWAGAAFRFEQETSGVTFAPDAKRLLTFDRAFQVWQVPTGALVAVSPPHDDGVTQARFSTDGRQVLTVSGTGSGQVWDTASGRAQTPPLRHGGPLAAAVIGTAGKRVVTVSRNGTVAVWELGRARRDDGPDVATAPVADLVAFARLLTGRAIDDGQERALTAEQLRAAWESRPRVP